VPGEGGVPPRARFLYGQDISRLCRRAIHIQRRFLSVYITPGVVWPRVAGCGINGGLARLPCPSTPSLLCFSLCPSIVSVLVYSTWGGTSLPLYTLEVPTKPSGLTPFPFKDWGPLAKLLLGLLSLSLLLIVSVCLFFFRGCYCFSNPGVSLICTFSRRPRGPPEGGPQAILDQAPRRQLRCEKPPGKGGGKTGPRGCFGVAQLCQFLFFRGGMGGPSRRFGQRMLAQGRVVLCDKLLFLSDRHPSLPRTTVEGGAQPFVWLKGVLTKGGNGAFLRLSQGGAQKRGPQGGFFFGRLVPGGGGGGGGRVAIFLFSPVVPLVPWTFTPKGPIFFFFKFLIVFEGGWIQIRAKGGGGPHGGAG